MYKVDLIINRIREHVLISHIVYDNPHKASIVLNKLYITADELINIAFELSKDDVAKVTLTTSKQCSSDLTTRHPEALVLIIEAKED